MAKKIGLSESLEDYLEIILALEKTSKVARVKDISEKMGVMRGSVTGALKNLADKGLINYEPYSYITLSRKGAAIAKEITRRHEVIKDFLHNVLLLDTDKAEKNACRFLEYVHTCPRTGDDWLNAFVNYYSKNEHDIRECEDCLKKCVTRYKESISQSL